MKCQFGAKASPFVDRGVWSNRAASKQAVNGSAESGELCEP